MKLRLNACRAINLHSYVKWNKTDIFFAFIFFVYLMQGRLSSIKMHGLNNIELVNMRLNWINFVILLEQNIF